MRASAAENNWMLNSSPLISGQAADLLRLFAGGFTHEGILTKAGTATFFDLFDAASEALSALDVSNRQDIFETLRAWRLEEARTEGVAAYVVFDNATLHAICEAYPLTPAELLSCHGVGPVKLEQHGAAVLGILEEHKRDTTTRAEAVSQLSRSVLELVATGHSIEQILATYPTLGEQGLAMAFAEAVERLAPEQPSESRSETGGGTLADEVAHVLGLRVDPRLRRFRQPGWSYEGFAGPVGCPQCGGSLHIFRKPYESAGKHYRYWAVVCASERIARDLDSLGPETTKALRDWSKSLVPSALSA